MSSYWEERILRASVRRAKEWAASNPIMFAVLFALPPFLIPAGISGIWTIPAGLIALVFALVIWFMALTMGTLLSMLYEVREELGRHLAPDATVASNDFDCELVDSDPDRVHVKVANRNATGRFHAKITEVDGEARNGTWPLTVRWLSDENATARRISRGDSEVLTVVRIRSRRAVDFLRPTGSEPPYQRVEALADGERWRVEARLVVFNETSEGVVGNQERVLHLCFEPGADVPTARELRPVVAHHR